MSLGRDDFLPSLEETREAGLTCMARMWWRLGVEQDLLLREPEVTRRVAAIVVRGRTQRRVTLAQRSEIPEQDVSRVPEPMPAYPDGYEARSSSVVTGVLGEAQWCSFCHDGRLLCSLCGGEGVIQIQSVVGELPAYKGCPSCMGAGILTCSHCAGTARTVAVRRLDVIDEVVKINYPFVPTMTFGIEEKVTNFIEGELQLDPRVPECLVVDLEPDKMGGPYRQATREPDFRGHGYGDALIQARAAIAGMRGDELIREELEIHARPILWLRYEIWNVRREVALFHDLQGSPIALVADGGL